MRLWVEVFKYLAAASDQSDATNCQSTLQIELSMKLEDYLPIANVMDSMEHIQFDNDQDSNFGKLRRSQRPRDEEVDEEEEGAAYLPVFVSQCCTLNTNRILLS